MCAESGLCAVIKHILGRAMFYATEIEGRGNMLRPSKGQFEWMHVLLSEKKMVTCNVPAALYRA
jgi:hypothetical protein